MSESDEITLKDAARLIRKYNDNLISIGDVRRAVLGDDAPESERPSNQPGAESTATLDAMLAASRRGKTVRG